MKRWKHERAQSTVEYAVLIAVVVAAVLVMQIYMKRGISGKVRESIDQVGEQFTPHTATYSLTRGRGGGRTDATTATGDITTTAHDETQTRAGNEEPVNTDMASEPLF